MVVISSRMSNSLESPSPQPATSSAIARQAGLLVKIETDRRLGHEWDEWDGKPLPNAGDFRTTTGKYFLFTAVGIAAIVAAGAVAIYLLSPRLAQLAWWLPRILYAADALFAAAGALWLALIGLSHATDRGLRPGRFVERGWLLTTLRLSAPVWETFGVRRECTDNAAVAVYDRLGWARACRVRGNGLLKVMPRCLSLAAL